MEIDLNADLGEGAGLDAELLALVTSANVSCGGQLGQLGTHLGGVELPVEQEHRAVFAAGCPLPGGPGPLLCSRGTMTTSATAVKATVARMRASRQVRDFLVLAERRDPRGRGPDGRPASGGGVRAAGSTGGTDIKAPRHRGATFR